MRTGSYQCACWIQAFKMYWSMVYAVYHVWKYFLTHSWIFLKIFPLSLTQRDPRQQHLHSFIHFLCPLILELGVTEVEAPVQFISKCGLGKVLLVFLKLSVWNISTTGYFLNPMIGNYKVLTERKERSYCQCKDGWGHLYYVILVLQNF